MARSQAPSEEKVNKRLVDFPPVASRARMCMFPDVAAWEEKCALTA
jgi:hypothetical protein